MKTRYSRVHLHFVVGSRTVRWGAVLRGKRRNHHRRRQAGLVATTSCRGPTGHGRQRWGWAPLSS